MSTANFLLLALLAQGVACVIGWALLCLIL